VVLAGGAIGTPALLLRSGLGGPNAGRRLFLHPVPAVFARYPDPIRMWSGVPQSVVSDAFARLDGAYGFRLEVPPVLPGIAAAGEAWRSAEQHRATMSEIDHYAAFIPIVRDREPGLVHVDRAGAALVAYGVRGADAAMCVRAIVETTKVHLAAGAREVRTLHTRPLAIEPGGDLRAFAAAVARRGVAPNSVGMFSAHQMGTAGMGAARDRVADPDGAVRGIHGLHVADASAFPNASGVNPMLTVMALARRNARRMLAV
jgi:choline dehydrogenase-like flavoprotein